MELIESLNSNNFETMNLLSFEERRSIPIKWVNLLLQQWHKSLENERLHRRLLNYLEHYLGLIESYTATLGNCPHTRQALQIIVSQSSQLAELDTILEEDSEEIKVCWKKVLQEHQDLIAQTPLEETI